VRGYSFPSYEETNGSGNHKGNEENENNEMDTATERNLNLTTAVVIQWFKL